MEEGNAPAVVGRWNKSRGLGTAVAAIIMVVVLVAVGAGAYFTFSGTKTGGGTSQSHPIVNCAPAASPICNGLSGGHDVFMSVPYRSVSAGIDIAFTAAYAGTGKVTYFLYNFGDGSAVVNSSSSTFHHNYTNAGTYIASVQAKITGQSALHDNYNKLLIVSVNPNTAGSAAFEVPQVSGAIIMNTTSSLNPTAVLDASGDSVQFNGSYSSEPTDPNAVPIPPTISVSDTKNSTISATNSGSTFINDTIAFSAPGTYVVTMNGGGMVGTTAYVSNYEWTVFVAQPGFHPGWIAGGSINHAGGSSYTGKSPHGGTLDIYEEVPGAARSLDPAVDYDTQGFEPIDNIFQTLVAYNGTQTGATYVSYVPQLATCIPGSPACGSLYGGGFTGISSDGQNWTFVISPTAQFYDPHTGAHWGVYPSDVMYSITRTLGFTTGIAVGATSGWIISQALEVGGNGTWDSSKGTFNDTPQNILSSMTVNDSNCPATAMSGAHGCITFHAFGNGGGPSPAVPQHTWPYFMEFVADGLGAGIVSCGFDSAPTQGGAVPGWTDVAANQGDHPCTLPGGVTTTSSTAFSTAVNALAPQSWDSWEKAGAGSGGTFPGNTQYNPVGSGPYYMKQFVGAAGYLLQANPAYVAPCTYKGCEPGAGTYAPSVSVTWEASATPGEQAYKAGIADQASVPLPDLSLLIGLVNGGSVSLISFPTISIYFFPFTMNFDVTSAQAIVPNVNVPDTFLSNEAVRQFIVHAYPYSSVEQTINQADGLTFGINYGGAIPISMQFSQQNISWPSGNPNSNPAVSGSAAWWWAQLVNVSSPYYDATLAACSSSSPCYLPIIGATGAPNIDEQMGAWGQDVSSLSGGVLQLSSADINFGTAVGYSTASAPGANPMPLYFLGWAPDYPDATDYVNPMYMPDATYTHSDAVSEQLTNTTQGYNNSGCHAYSDYGWWAVMAQTAGGIPENCQGSAYDAMVTALNLAAVDSNATTRNLYYWAAESIANGLALYMYDYQSNVVESYASWLLGSSFNQNVTIGGGNANLWYTVVYAATGNGASD